MSSLLKCHSAKHLLTARKVWKATDGLEGMYTQQLRNATHYEHHKLTCACHQSCHFGLLLKSLFNWYCFAPLVSWVYILANPRLVSVLTYSHEWYGYSGVTLSYETHHFYNHWQDQDEVYIHFIRQPLITLALWTNTFYSISVFLCMYKVYTFGDKLSQQLFILCTSKGT